MARAKKRRSLPVRLLRGLGILILVIVILAAVLIGFLSATEYRPADRETVPAAVGASPASISSVSPSGSSTSVQSPCPTSMQCTRSTAADGSHGGTEVPAGARRSAHPDSSAASRTASAAVRAAARSGPRADPVLTVFSPSRKAAPDKQKSFVPDGGASPPSGRAPGQAEAKLF